MSDIKTGMNFLVKQTYNITKNKIIKQINTRPTNEKYVAKMFGANKFDFFFEFCAKG